MATPHFLMVTATAKALISQPTDFSELPMSRWQTQIADEPSVFPRSAANLTALITSTDAMVACCSLSLSYTRTFFCEMVTTFPVTSSYSVFLVQSGWDLQ